MIIKVPVSCNALTADGDTFSGSETIEDTAVDDVA